MKKKILPFVVLCAAVFLGVLLFADVRKRPKEQKISKTELLMDTVVTVTLWDCEDEDILEGCMSLCRDLDAQFDNYNEDSEISMINSHPGQEVPVSADTAELLLKGQEYEALSKGKFSMEIGAVSGLWDFHQESSRVPADDEIKEALKTVGGRLTVKEDSASVSMDGTKLDLGAIAKGYIADRLKSYLKSRGVEHGLIYLGGNVLAFEGKPDGSPFTVGIQEPFTEKIRTGLKVTGGSVVTSGVYQRCFEQDGKRYHHILDPDTGYPAETDLYSATVLSEASVDGDALSTICMLLGLDEAKALIEGMDGVEAVFITDQDELVYTSGITKELLTD